MKPVTKYLAATALVGALAAPNSTLAQANENVMVVFDGSNSMWGQIDGTAKIDIARGVMKNLLGEWTENRQVGLMAYGHRRRGDCTDIETLVAPGQATRDDILDRINAITPTGKTPLTTAVEEAARQMSYTDQPATVILISDGLESCGRDACALAETLEKGGVGFTAHVVGFGLAGDTDTASLSCIAENTGGTYLSAANASELGQALSAVSTAVATAPVPVPIPEPEPEPDLPQVAITTPANAIAGSEFAIAWTMGPDAGDYITIVKPDAADGAWDNYLTVGDKTDGRIRAPAWPGIYDMRYVTGGNEVLGKVQIEIVDPEVTLTGPATAPTGAPLTLDWTNPVHQSDYVTIVPVGAEDSVYNSYYTVRDTTRGKINAASTPGLYELRYILAEGPRTVARQAIELTEPQVTLSAPDKVLTGETFRLGWTGTVHPNDYITILPVGAEEGTYARYVTVRDDSKGTLPAPAEPGLYELRYIISEGARTVARRAIEVAEPEITLDAPATARAGEKIPVSWTGAVAGQDFITIVPVGADEGTYTTYVRVRENAKDKLQGPAEPGLYELRYVLAEGARTMATRPIEITEPRVTVSGPATALTGEKIRVEWSGTVDGQDYITVVPVGSDEGTYTNYIRVRENNRDALQVPAEPGLYELRYVLNQGARTVARQPIEIVEPEITVAGPASVTTGAKVPVTWTGTVNEQDYITIVPAGAEEGTYTNYIRVRDKAKGEVLAPADPGLYELRYVLNQGNRTMTSQMIEVTAPAATLNAPATALAGSLIVVEYGGAPNPQDFITIVPMGADEGSYAGYIRVRDTAKGELRAPSDPGLYEIRLILNQGRRTLARQMIEITEPEVTVTGPDTVRTGDEVAVTWTGTVDKQDYVTLVPLGTPDDTLVDYFLVRDTGKGKFKAPAQTGMYELRYVLREGARVLARQTIEIVAADAALSEGAELSAPVSAAAGSMVAVGWSVASAGGDQRITLARTDQAIFTWITALKAADGPPVQMPMPAEPGTYELRFLDVTQQKVLARKVIKVE